MQINVGQVDPVTGRFTGDVTPIAISGYVRDHVSLRAVQKTLNAAFALVPQALPPANRPRFFFASTVGVGRSALAPCLQGHPQRQRPLNSRGRLQPKYKPAVTLRVMMCNTSLGIIRVRNALFLSWGLFRNV